MKDYLRKDFEIKEQADPYKGDGGIRAIYLKTIIDNLMMTINAEIQIKQMKLKMERLLEENQEQVSGLNGMVVDRLVEEAGIKK